MQRAASLLSGSDSVALALDSWGSSRGGIGRPRDLLCRLPASPLLLTTAGNPLTKPRFSLATLRLRSRARMDDDDCQRHRSGASVGPSLRLHTTAPGAAGRPPDPLLRTGIWQQLPVPRVTRPPHYVLASSSPHKLAPAAQTVCFSRQRIVIPPLTSNVHPSAGPQPAVTYLRYSQAHGVHAHCSVSRRFRSTEEALAKLLSTPKKGIWNRTWSTGTGPRVSSRG